MPPKLPDVKQKVEIVDGYKKPLADIRGNIQKTRQNFRGLAGDIRQLNEFGSLKKLKKRIRGVKDASAGIGRGLSTSFQRVRTGALVATAGVTGLLFGVKKLTDAFSVVEDAEASFTPLLGGVAKAKKLVAELNKTAATTPFQFESLAGVAKQLLPSMNGNIKDTIRLTRMLGDTAGGNAVKMESITRGFNKALIKGRVDLEGLNIIAEAGVPIFQELGKSLGVSGQKMFKNISAGKVSVSDLRETFRRMTSEGGLFFRGMEIASETLSGKISTLKDNIILLAADMGGELAPMFKKLIDKALRFITEHKAKIISVFKNFVSKIPEFTRKLMNFFKGMRDTLGPIFSWLGKVINAVGWKESALFGFAAWIGGPFILSMKNIIPLVTDLTGAVKIAIPMVKGLGAAFGLAGGPVGWVVVGIGALIAAMIIFRKELTPIIDGFRDGLNPVLEAARGLFDDLKGMVTDLNGVLGDTGMTGIMSNLVTVWATSVGWFAKMHILISTLPLRIIAKQVRAGARAFGWFSREVKKVTDMVRSGLRPELALAGRKFDAFKEKIKSLIAPLKKVQELIKKGARAIGIAPEGKTATPTEKGLDPNSPQGRRRAGISGQNLVEQVAGLGGAPSPFKEATLTEKVAQAGGVGGGSVADLLAATGGGVAKSENKVLIDFANMPKGVEVETSGDGGVEVDDGPAFGEG